MGLLKDAIDMLLHVDSYLATLVQNFGATSYLVLFLIIFLETGIVLTPFLPGDSLLFLAGTFAAQGYLNVMYVLFLLSSAAILGDSVNYVIGKYAGVYIIEKKKMVKQEYVEKTKRFFEKHGAKTIIMARFIPIVRTLAPCIAGMSTMNYKRFLSYNIIGGVVWVVLFVIAGYLFGNIPFVEKHLELIVLSIILASIIPPLIGYLQSRKKKKSS